MNGIEPDGAVKPGQRLDRPAAQRQQISHLINAFGIIGIEFNGPPEAVFGAIIVAQYIWMKDSTRWPVGWSRASMMALVARPAPVVSTSSGAQP